MTISAFKGPVGSYGKEPLADSTEWQGPDFHANGSMLMDPRGYVGYAGGDWLCGWLQSARGYITIDSTPAAINATAIAAAYTGSGAVTLASANNSSAGVVVNASAVNVNTGAVTTGYVAISCPNATATSTFLAFGNSGVNGNRGVNIWDPNAAVGRTITITSSGTDSGKTATVAGADIYGVPVTASVALGNTSAASTTKAFKYISSVTLSTAPAGNITIGFGTVFGLPLRADALNYVQAFHLTSSAVAITAAVTSSATAATGDVRGSVVVAVTGTSQLTVYQSLPASALVSLSQGTVSGLVGVTQA